MIPIFSFFKPLNELGDIGVALILESHRVLIIVFGAGVINQVLNPTCRRARWRTNSPGIGTTWPLL
jgi:hypothetical protein